MNETYRKLVDLYAGDELPEELAQELHAAATSDRDLAHDMLTLRHTVEALRDLPQPEFTDESFERILMNLYAAGAAAEPRAPAPTYLQYFLPIAG